MSKEIAFYSMIIKSIQSNLKTNVGNEKVIDIWTKYASMDGENNVLSFDELDMLMEDNLEKGFTKYFIKSLAKNNSIYKNGIPFHIFKSFIIHEVNNPKVFDMTLEEALPACKKGLTYVSERYQWHLEWVDRLIKQKNLPEKYQGNDGYDLFISEKTIEFEKNYKP